MLVGGDGETNPNTNWIESRGLWFSYCLAILAFHLVLLSIPFITVPVAWTVTNVFHNFFHLVFLHTLKANLWLSQYEGPCKMLTHWEQIDNGLHFTKTKKFLFIIPVLLFFITNFYTKYDPVHFYINFVSLMVVLLPKLPHFHKHNIVEMIYPLADNLQSMSMNIWNKGESTEQCSRYSNKKVTPKVLQILGKLPKKIV